MPEPVLMIFRIPVSDDEKVAIGKIGDRIDVKAVDWDPYRERRGLEQAIQYSKDNERDLVVLLILSSDLYHWGFNDIILPGPAKSRFIGHIREEIMKSSVDFTSMLKKTAGREGINLIIKKVETMDPLTTALEEAKKGYNRIFIAKQKKTIFPLFKKRIEDLLMKKLSTPIITY